MVVGVCNFFSTVSPQQKFEAADRPVLQLSYSSVLFGKRRKTHSGGVRAGGPKGSKEERGLSSVLARHFICFFSSPTLPYVNRVNQQGCLFYLRFLCSVFMGFFLCLSHRYFGLLFPFLTPWQHVFFYKVLSWSIQLCVSLTKKRKFPIDLRRKDIFNLLYMIEGGNLLYFFLRPLTDHFSTLVHLF